MVFFGNGGECCDISFSLFSKSRVKTCSLVEVSKEILWEIIWKYAYGEILRGSYLGHWTKILLTTNLLPLTVPSVSSAVN